MADPILPIVDDIVARGVNKLVQLRPSAAPFVVSGKGVYYDAFAGWKAQLLLLRQRLADEVISRRLGTPERPLAKGKALAELAASEFFAEILPEPQTAIGNVRLQRLTLAAGGGTIQKGTKFRIAANPTAPVPIPEASFESSEPIVVGPATSSVFVPLAATRPGTDGNSPLYAPGTSAPILIADAIFDPAFQVVDARVAGGSSGPSDRDIVQLAKAMYTGQYAPTAAALVAGALTDAGVKHVTTLTDTVLGQAILFVADESWAQSDEFLSLVIQSLKDRPWAGFGTSISVRGVLNVLATLSATVVLADPKFIDDTSDLRAIIRDRVRRYLDDRPDFYTFNLKAIGGIIATADPRILTCTDVAMTDPATGDPIVPTPLNRLLSSAYHYILPDNGVNLTVTFPT